MLRVFTIIFLLIGLSAVQGQPPGIGSFYIHGDIKVTIDRPARSRQHKETLVIFYALPNGNTTAQTMGKKMSPGDDWHFDIQHIRAQTVFIRQQLKNKNVMVVYLENDHKSWPLWKQKHPDFRILIPKIVDSLAELADSKRKIIYLNGHSGGGSFIFGYLAGVRTIPRNVRRISFLDSNYGYDSSYYPALRQWLNHVKGAALNVFAYNDSIALYNGKPVVSATGGTWYRGHLMLKHLLGDFMFSKTISDSLIVYKSADEKIQFFFKHNLNRGIYHTQQVELNGFIHSVLCGTKNDSGKYQYYSARAYSGLIE
jgi:hypothetical protein